VGASGRGDDKSFPKNLGNDFGGSDLGGNEWEGGMTNFGNAGGCANTESA
jgi:hypothetical protein